MSRISVHRAGAPLAAGRAEIHSVTVIEVAQRVALPLCAARRRWAELLRRILEVDPLACPRCRGLMRIVAVITDPAVITRVLAYRVRARDPAPTAAGHPHQ